MFGRLIDALRIIVDDHQLFELVAFGAVFTEHLTPPLTSLPDPVSASGPTVDQWLMHLWAVRQWGAAEMLRLG